jgi:hypothetical protein
MAAKDSVTAWLCNVRSLQHVQQQAGRPPASLPGHWAMASALSGGTKPLSSFLDLPVLSEQELQQLIKLQVRFASKVSVATSNPCRTV